MSVEIPNWIKTLVVKQLLKTAPDLADAWQNDKVPELNALAANLRDGGTLKDGLEAYFEATESIKDDEVMAKVDEVFDKIVKYSQEVLTALDGKPFLEVVEDHAGSVVIPDFNKNPDDDISVADFIADLVKTLAN